MFPIVCDCRGNIGKTGSRFLPSQPVAEFCNGRRSFPNFCTHWPQLWMDSALKGKAHKSKIADGLMLLHSQLSLLIVDETCIQISEDLCRPGIFPTYVKTMDERNNENLNRGRSFLMWFKPLI